MKSKVLVASSAAFFGFFFFYLSLLGLINFVYADKAIPGLKIENIDVGGKTKSQIIDILNKKIDSFRLKTLEVSVENDKWTIKVSDLNLEYSVAEIAAKSIQFGKGSWNIFPIFSERIELSPKISGDKFAELSADIIKKENKPVANAKFVLSGNNLTISEEQEGVRLSVENIRDGFEKSLAHFESKVDLQKEILKPQITKNELEAKKDKILEYLEKPLTIKAAGFIEKVDKNTLLGFLEVNNEKANSVVLREEIFPSGKEGDILVFNKEAVGNYVKEVAKKVNVSAQNAVLGLEDGRVIVKTPSQDAKILEEEKAIDKIAGDAKDKEEINLPVKITKAEINEANLKELGLKELVSYGISNFSGSPQNRRENIRVGASKFNGALIKPGETFSFNTNLGEVDAAHGFLPELVILENKTVPQYGGGLCQVSSTAFRAALNAGFPIVARTNHAYPVQYYYPLGADATIYLPEPDLKFTNDSGAYIYIQTSISGNYLRFDFFGTKPQRTVRFSANEDGSWYVSRVEDVSPYIFNQGVRGNGSADSIFYRFIYDSTGKLLDKYKNLSKYDSPDKYPH
ncbi:MAG: VanW family protein [Patescibacteria group bacterium]|nr:VanW family protein [Patescibacteria group bacterium]